MKNLRLFSGLICTALFFIACKSLNDNCLKPDQTLQEYFKWTPDRKSPLIMAHRMAPKSGFADNGYQTLKYTYKKAPCVIQEMDVRMSKDSVLYMLHDSTLNRTTTGTGNLNHLLSNEVQKLELKDINGNLLKGQRIPRLSKVLEFVKQNKMVIALDMKPKTDPIRLMEEVVASGTLNNIFVICYTVKEAIAFNKKYPKLMLALGFNSWDNIKTIEQSGLPFQNLIALTPTALQEKPFYDKIHSMGIMVSFSAQGGVDVYPNNAAEAYKNVFALGGDIICTDSLTNVERVFK